MTPDELKAHWMAQAEAMIDKMLARKPKTEDITLSDIEQLAIGGGQDFREAVLNSLVGERVLMLGSVVIRGAPQ